MAEIIDGKLVSSEVRKNITEEVKNFINETGKTPGLAVILVGNDPASAVYVRNKHKGCLDVGINSYEIKMPEETTEDELLAKIDELNSDDKVDGILVQLPLPQHICEDKIINAINPSKDVDAFHPVNTGKIMIGDYDFLPCTPAGVMRLLEEYGIDPSGKNCVVVGRSNIVGKPQAMLLLQKNGTVTICHSRTADLKAECRRADILVVAIGKAKFIDADYIKPGATVIDVGMDRDENGKLCGDVDFDSVEPVCGAITPVPGGVGPITVNTLMYHTILAALRQRGSE